MRLSITTLQGDIFNLDVSADIELENLKALCEVESGIPAQEIVVMHDGRTVTQDKQDLKTLGIKDGDVLLIQKQQTQSASLNQPASGSSTSGALDNPEFIRQRILSNPAERSLLTEHNSRLAAALDNAADFARVLAEQQREKMERDRLRIRAMNADPFDAEAQRYIAEEIQQQNILSNMEAAIEFHPENFGVVHMLYINCKVNGHPVKAFVDSGAQSTIMSQHCAERCEIMRLVDRRFSGIAKGVGTQRIIGRIHLGQLEIEGVFLSSNFCVLEDQPMDMLLGLDMLKRHQCCIDLKRNVLVIGTTSTETPFLPENELPECARVAVATPPPGAEPMDEDADLARALAISQRESAQANRGAATAAPSVAGSVNESDVREMMAMGFARELCVEELRKANGDRVKAITALLAKSIIVPPSL